jgi:hypothetical protein
MKKRRVCVFRIDSLDVALASDRVKGSAFKVQGHSVLKGSAFKVEGDRVLKGSSFKVEGDKSSQGFSIQG